MNGIAPAERQLVTTLRRTPCRLTRRRYHQSLRPASKGLFRAAYPLAALRRRGWPPGTFAIHNLPTVRNASFARSIPKLAGKLLRIPALFGGATVAGLAYLQYQATQAGNYVKGVFNQVSATAGGAASDLFTGAKDVSDQFRSGWENTKEGLAVPEWLQALLEPSSGTSSGGESKGSNGPQSQAQQSRAGGAAIVGGTTAAVLGTTADDDERSETEMATDDQMMVLTKKMIEIRNILSQVGQSDTLTLPSIVVIGSQSSGKSSVLEAIVGHEFLPKGSNMVTRRPIELTLVNTPDAAAEYGEFPALGLAKITDFTSIQRTLTDLNLAVPVEQCVSDDPIRLSIYSPNVPDLSLIDLPGYIQLSGTDQPDELKQKISDLCDRYIQAPNIILAISAADVDLANSTALRASRKVDPRGERTIGVITKMDLVEPPRAASMLTDRKYPLRLGYVGVVCKVPTQSGLFSRGSANITKVVMKNEDAYFSSHPLEFGPESELSIGTKTLRKKLMNVLEQTMAASLQGTQDAIQQELEEASYEFKVQYNDRPLTAESYLAESLDEFKRSFKSFSEGFGRVQVRELLKSELDQRVLDLLAQRYWNKPITDMNVQAPDPDPLSSLPTADPENMLWHRKLDASTSSLTKLGIGRVATTIVSNALQAQIESLGRSSKFASHPMARAAIMDAASSILNERFYSTSDQVENCIKPYKFEIEVDDQEWGKGRSNIASVLKGEMNACDQALAKSEELVGGRRKLKDVMSFVDRVRKGEIVLEGDGRGGAGGYSAALIQKGREAVFLRDRGGILKMRLAAVNSRKCGSKDNKYYCPEVFLDVVADKLTSTAVLFLNVELLSEFYYHVSCPPHAYPIV